jgi:hypothetical protein
MDSTLHAFLYINLMGIVCDFNYSCFQQKPTPNPSKEGNSILRENNIITFKSRRVNKMSIQYNFRGLLINHLSLTIVKR